MAMSMAQFAHTANLEKISYNVDQMKAIFSEAAQELQPIFNRPIQGRDAYDPQQQHKIWRREKLLMGFKTYEKLCAEVKHIIPTINSELNSMNELIKAQSERDYEIFKLKKKLQESSETNRRTDAEVKTLKSMVARLRESNTTCEMEKKAQAKKRQEQDLRISELTAELNKLSIQPPTPKSALMLSTLQNETKSLRMENERLRATHLEDTQKLNHSQAQLVKTKDEHVKTAMTVKDIKQRLGFLESKFQEKMKENKALRSQLKARKSTSSTAPRARVESTESAIKPTGRDVITGPIKVATVPGPSASVHAHVQQAPQEDKPVEPEQAGCSGKRALTQQQPLRTAGNCEGNAAGISKSATNCVVTAAVPGAQDRGTATDKAEEPLKEAYKNAPAVAVTTPKVAVCEAKKPVEKSAPKPECEEEDEESEYSDDDEAADGGFDVLDMIDRSHIKDSDDDEPAEKSTPITKKAAVEEEEDEEEPSEYSDDDDGDAGGFSVFDMIDRTHIKDSDDEEPAVKATPVSKKAVVEEEDDEEEPSEYSDDDGDAGEFSVLDMIDRTHIKDSDDEEATKPTCTTNLNDAEFLLGKGAGNAAKEKVMSYKSAVGASAKRGSLKDGWVEVPPTKTTPKPELKKEFLGSSYWSPLLPNVDLDEFKPAAPKRDEPKLTAQSKSIVNDMNDIQKELDAIEPAKQLLAAEKDKKMANVVVNEATKLPSV